MGDQSVSKEMNEVQTWIAGHEATCTERYKDIRQDNADLKSSVDRLTKQIIGIKRGLRAEMKASDAAIETRVRKVEKEQQIQKVQRAYFVGAMAGASFVGGLIGPILASFLNRIFQ